MREVSDCVPGYSCLFSKHARRTGTDWNLPYSPHAPWSCFIRSLWFTATCHALIMPSDAGDCRPSAVNLGEPIAVLTGDAPIVRALQLMASPPASHWREAMKIVDLLGNAVAGDEGVIAGQVMEEQHEAMPPNQSAKELLARYHYRKMAALFRAACLAGQLQPEQTTRRPGLRSEITPEPIINSRTTSSTAARTRN